jgi:SapC
MPEGRLLAALCFFVWGKLGGETPMTNTVLLDNVRHKDLRVRTGFAAEFGDSISSCVVFPTEFVHVHREYPILFRKDTNGDLQAMALLGLDKDENLFLDETGWNARYVPAIQQRGPFLIGFRQTDIDGQTVREPVIHVDLDHPRISDSEGEPVFLRHGGNSPYLERANRMLQIIYKGAEHAKPMFAAFEEAGLIEEIDVEIELDERAKYKVPGFLTISHDRLTELGGVELERLNKSGYLQLAMLVMTSLGNVSWLIELKNRKRAAVRA